MGEIITNREDSNLKKELIRIANFADRLAVAVAFFSDHALLNKWSMENKKINLIVSLRPPTNYYSLKAIQSAINIETNFLGDDFHSKFIIFYKNDLAIAAVLGSSNFTQGGLTNNIETNILSEDVAILSQLQDHFNLLINDSNLLQPTDLDDYEIVYKNYLARRNKEDAEVDKFRKKITKNRTKRKNKVRITKEAKQYFDFWKVVDEVRSLVKNISDKEYPNIPYYLTLDHFWHYVKAIWHKETGEILSRSQQHIEIPKLFKKYAEWDKNGGGGNYTKLMALTSKRVFQFYLSDQNIDKLTKTQAKEVFRSLHSSGMRTKRFSADESFIDDNNIRKIKRSLKYLLYSNDEVDLRIHNLMKNPTYKLQGLGSSGIQEINGWTRPGIYPIRNDKADTAIELLGYSLG